MALKINKFLGIAACLIFTSSMSHAITLDAGESICEGPDVLLPDEAVCAETFGDGGQTGGPLIELTFTGSGEATIFGGIRGEDETRFADVFNLVGEGMYRLTLTSLRFTDPSGNGEDAPFDATWTVGGTEVGTIGNITDPEVTSLTTTVDLSEGSVFNLNAAGGATGRNVMEYELTIAAVPLPAGLLLLLTGLGGLALARRRTTA